MEFQEITVWVPATQYARLEADALEEGRSVEEHASFLLPEWVATTRMRRGSAIRARENRGISAAAQRDGEAVEAGNDRGISAAAQMEGGR